MCFRPNTVVKKREIACPNCQKMNPLPLAIESTISDLMADESAKAILEKHCAVVTSDPRFKMAMKGTLKQIVPLSNGKLTIAMIKLVAEDLAQLPVTKECKFCGEIIPQMEEIQAQAKK